MTRHEKISRASGPPVSGAQDAAVSIPANETAATSIGVAPHSCGGLTDPTVAAGAPNRDTYLDDGYGLQPRCITCRKGMSNCLCDAPDIDVPSATDMKRIYPSLFERSSFGMLPGGWNRVEL